MTTKNYYIYVKYNNIKIYYKYIYDKTIFIIKPSYIIILEYIYIYGNFSK